MTRLMLLAISATFAFGTAQAHGGNVEAGKKRYFENCFQCHGKTGKGMASFPAIKGRDADYINDRLTKYRAREKVGPNSAIMMSLAKDLSDDDIDNLAAYVAEAFQ